MALCRTVRPLVVLLAAAPLAAQWVPVPALNAPPSRSGFTLTPLPNGEMLLFGGDINNPAATEWSWSGISWTPVTTPVPRRQFHAMAVDETDGTLVLFGGVGVGGPLTDTWTFNGTAWTQVTTLNAPPSLSSMSMAFDPANGSMILIGAPGVSGVFETWQLSQGNWTQLTTAVITQGAARVYHDSVRRELALFAVGAGVTTYRLAGAVWQQTGSAAALPGANSNLLATFDRDRGRLVVFLPQFTNLTFEWDGLSGTLLPSATPPFSFFPANAYHAVRSETIHVETNGPLAVWRWAPEPVPLAMAHGTPCQDPAFQLRLAPGDSPQPGASHRLQAVGTNGAFLTFSLIGFSHTSFSGLPLPVPIPLGALGCLLRVEPTLITFLGTGLPAQLQLTLPNSSSLIGQRYDAQAIQFDASGVLDTTNGLEVQVGLPLAEHPIVETFATAANRDPLASGDVWGSGFVTPVALGGDGRHGSFDHLHGTLNPTTGEYEFDNDNFVVTAERSMTGLPYLITDGKYYFTDFVVPDGVKVRFLGSVPAQIFVRGQTDIRGTIDVSGLEMPFRIPPVGESGAGQKVSTFNSRGLSIFVPGQPGGAPGCGGGRGGDGADECRSTGPDIVPGFPPPYDGRVGQDVRVPAGHAYGASTLGTGGMGGVLNPASGLTVNTVLMATLYRAHFSQGGSGGGYMLPGGQSTGNPLIGAVFSPTSAPGTPFPLLPYPPVAPPPGYSALNHFLVAGSGGGGGGSASFGTFGFSSVATLPPNVYQAGHGGTGGGGAVAIRTGNSLVVATTGILRAKGGVAHLITGDAPGGTQDINWGISSPGGGGSGGSFLLQSSAGVNFQGTVDTGGGVGGRTGFIAPASINQVSQAGSGAHGFYRLEAPGTVTFTGTGTPAYVPADNSGPLTDQDDRSGSRSFWLLPPTTDLPVYLRYELVVDVNGSTVTFSDDPSVSLLRADDPTGAAVLRFQGARTDPLTGIVVPSTIGPWRTSLRPGGEHSVNRDRAKVLRFDLALNKNVGTVSVRELRLFWR